MAITRWATWLTRHRRAVIAAWLVVLTAGVLAWPFLSGRLGAPDYGVPGSQSARASALIAAHFSGQGDEQDVIVFKAVSGTVTSPVHRAAIGTVMAAARRSAGVAGVLGPFDAGASQQVSRDRRAALGFVALRGNTRQLAKRAKTLQSAITAATAPGMRAWLTGYSPVTNDLTKVEDASTQNSESIGLPAALAVLVVALGALVAAALPLLLATAGMLLAFGVIALLSLGFSYDAFLLVIVSMIGTGIGIDYSLFIVSRFREELARRGPAARQDRRARDAAIADVLAATLRTSGRTIAASGLIVAVSMCSLFLINSPVFREITVGVLVVVASTLAAAWSLLPAILAALGPKVGAGRLPRRFQPADASGTGHGSWARWARVVMRLAVPAAAAAVALLAVAAIPLGSLRYGIDLGTASLAGQPTAAAQRVLDAEFGPGLVSPVQVVVTSHGDQPMNQADLARAAALAAAIRRDHAVAATATMTAGGRMLITAIPSVPIDSPAATALIARIRTTMAPHASAGAPLTIVVGGATAEFTDVSHETRAKIPAILAIVLILSALFLMVIFRSVVLPLTAVVMNVLATAAATGLTVAVFQWGWASRLLGFTSPGFLQVYIPITVFVMLFGLSMDYEVFLISRMRETWDATGDNQLAIATGLEHTARPIAAAAAIMVVVFGSFTTASVLELKEFGLALAVAIALDATLIRLILVPAVMRLLGPANWWLPAAFSRRPRTATLQPATSPSESARTGPAT